MSYLEGEPLWIERIFESKENVKLDFKPAVVPYGDLKYEIINSKNDTLKYQIGTGTFIGSDYNGKPIWGLDDLIDYYGSPENFESSSLYQQFYIPADDYYIQAKLQVASGNKYTTIYSNKIFVKVSKPMGQDSIEYQKWIEFYLTAFEVKDFSNVIDNADKYSE